MQASRMMVTRDRTQQYEPSTWIQLDIDASLGVSDILLGDVIAEDELIFYLLSCSFGCLVVQSVQQESS